MYDDATIDRKAYEHLTMRLNSYLSTELALPIFANFLRSHHEYQKFFQLCRDCHGQPQFLKAETLFHYEHSSNFRIADATHEKLLAEVSDEDFVHYELPGRIRCDELEKLIETKKIDVRRQEDREILRKYIEPIVTDAQQFVDELADFVHIEAKLPTSDKNFIPANPIEITIDQSREQIIDYLQQIRQSNTTADLAFYAYRDMETCDWAPFIKAAIERNPVSLTMAESMSYDEVYAWLEQMNNASIYGDKRLAQPDEVANYKTGDGLEKAFLLANVIRQRTPEQDVEIVADKNVVILKGPGEHRFISAKGLKKQVNISGDGSIDMAE
jgi:hypothetical protein